MSELAEVEKKEENLKLRDEEKPEMFSEDENVNRSNMCIGNDDKFTANAFLHNNNTGNYVKSFKNSSISFLMLSKNKWNKLDTNHLDQDNS